MCSTTSRLRLATLARHARRVPLVVRTLIGYARARRRMARESDVRKLLAAARHARRSRNRALSVQEARLVAHTVSLTLALLPTDPRCLVRSLVLIELLARRGIDATLVIGTSARPDFSAHAWVELGGEALLSPGSFAGGRLAEL
jgi:Transglutaminase-like superfamily